MAQGLLIQESFGEEASEHLHKQVLINQVGEQMHDLLYELIKLVFLDLEPASLSQYCVSVSREHLCHGHSPSLSSVSVQERFEGDLSGSLEDNVAVEALLDHEHVLIQQLDQLLNYLTLRDHLLDPHLLLIIGSMVPCQDQCLLLLCAPSCV